MFTVCDTVLAAYSMDKSVACRHKWNSIVDSIYSDALLCLVYHLYWHHNNGPWWNAWYQTSKNAVVRNYLFLTCNFTFSFHLLEKFQGMNIHWNLITNFISWVLIHTQNTKCMVMWLPTLGYRRSPTLLTFSYRRTVGSLLPHDYRLSVHFLLFTFINNSSSVGVFFFIISCLLAQWLSHMYYRRFLHP